MQWSQHSIWLTHVGKWKCKVAKNTNSKLQLKIVHKYSTRVNVLSYSLSVFLIFLIT